MTNSTRRGFLMGAGAGIGALAATSVLPASTGAGQEHAEPASSSAALPEHASGALMAYVNDVHSGEVAVMVEGREVTVVDHQLVARLAEVLHTDPSTLA